MEVQEALRAVRRASAQRVRRIIDRLREQSANVPQPLSAEEFSKIIQHPTLLRRETLLLIEQILEEDRARLLEPVGPKILRGWSPRPRPKTAIIARAAQAALERRLAREKLAAERAAFTSQRRA